MRPPIERVWTAALVGLAVVAAWHPITSVDVFFHMDLGRAVLRAGSWVVPEPASFVGEGAPRVVPQWLWAVSAYGLYEAFGAGALVLVTMVIAGAGAYLVCRLVARVEGDGSTAARMAVAGLATTALMSRTAVRPQAMFMLLLPAWMLLSYAYEAARGRTRVRLGAALVLTMLLWVHVHGSFVLAPAVLGVVVAPRVLAGRLEHWRIDLPVAIGLLLAIATNAFGLELPAYVLSHGWSDAARHNLEFATLGWTWLNDQWLPTLLWALALFGVFRRGRPAIAEIGLLLLGAALAFRSARFVAAASILAAPLAVLGAARLDRLARDAWPGFRVAGPVLAALLVLPPLVSWLSLSAQIRAPIGSIGLTPGEHPVLAWAHLRGAPPGTNVFTSYGASAQLGFFADGHVRTYIDGRTPLHFDDTDGAVGRDAVANADALDRVLRRYDVQAAVVSRSEPACRHLAERWRPVVVEARYTTFAPVPPARALAGIEPCGPQLVGPRLCADPAALDRSLERLDALGPSPLTGLLRAERILRCGGDLDEARTLLPRARDAFSFRLAHRRTRIALHVAAGELDEARALIAEGIAARDFQVLAALGPSGVGAFPPDEAREILALLAQEMDDATRPATRVQLARYCVQLEDFACARFQGTRAAVRGDRRALPVLRWLAQNDPDPLARADAAAWVRSLRAEAPRARPGDRAVPAR